LAGLTSGTTLRVWGDRLEVVLREPNPQRADDLFDQRLPLLRVGRAELVGSIVNTV
jgi:hypothetical protein